MIPMSFLLKVTFTNFNKKVHALFIHTNVYSSLHFFKTHIVQSSRY